MNLKLHVNVNKNRKYMRFPFDMLIIITVASIHKYERSSCYNSMFFMGIKPPIQKMCGYQAFSISTEFLGKKSFFETLK